MTHFQLGDRHPLVELLLERDDVIRGVGDVHFDRVGRDDSDSFAHFLLIYLACFALLTGKLRPAAGGVHQ